MRGAGQHARADTDDKRWTSGEGVGRAGAGSWDLLAPPPPELLADEDLTSPRKRPQRCEEMVELRHQPAIAGTHAGMAAAAWHDACAGVVQAADLALEAVAPGREHTMCTWQDAVARHTNAVSGGVTWA